MNGGISPSGYHSKYNSEADTISISEGGNSCGYVQFNKDKFWSGGHCYTLTNINSNILNKYLYYYLKYSEQNIMSLRIGSGLPNIQKKDIEKYEVIYPNYNNQIKIVSGLDFLEAKLEMEQLIISYLTLQKQYLLRNLFI
jgi:type I restriction enzyme S subunit